MSEKKEYDNTKRVWFHPKKRSQYYVADLRGGKIMGGHNKGKELDPYEKGKRVGYLQAQNDHTGLSKYREMYNYSNGNKAAAKEFSESKEHAPKGMTFMDHVAAFFARFTGKKN